MSLASTTRPNGLAQQFMRLLGVQNAFVFVGRGLKEVPQRERGLSEYASAYLLLWDTKVVGPASIAMRGIRFHDADENCSLENLVDEKSADFIIVMIMAEEIDDAIRQEAPQDIREIPGETPNVRSLRVLRTGTQHQKKKELRSSAPFD